MDAVTLKLVDNRYSPDTVLGKALSTIFHSAD